MKKSRSIHIKLSAYIVLACLFLFSNNSFGNTYNIPVGTITDHSNPNISGSIADYISTYGTGHVYNLSSDSTYYINNPIYLPASSELTTNNSATIRATSLLDNQVMVYMDNGSAVSELELHGARYAANILWAVGKSSISIENCIIHKTKNNYTTPNASKPHLINIENSSYALISGNLLRHASCDPNYNSDSWLWGDQYYTGGKAAGIYAALSDNLTITDNDIGTTLNAGVDISGCGQYVTISGNYIRESCQMTERFPVPDDQNRPSGGDGITGYSNNQGYTYLYWTITDNDISYSGNHGIHVSGRKIDIQNNTIYSQYLNAIRLDDQNAVDCSSTVTIKYNYVERGDYNANQYSIYYNHYKTGTVAVSYNTGDVDVDDIYAGTTYCQ